MIDFAAPVYYALLTAGQLGQLEKLQSRALKTIFGWNTSYKNAIEYGGVERIESRLRLLFQNFATRAVKTKRFQGWFPLNENPLHATRYREKYFVPTTKTSRLKKNPIYQMRRYLNKRAEEEKGHPAGKAVCEHRALTEA